LGGVDEKMKLSIVVCAYNEEKCIRNLLQNLPGQRLPPEIKDYEIILVASGCTDETVPIIREFMAKNSRIKLIEEEERLGKSEALNKALAAASGEYIALIPADVVPARNGLYHLLLPLRDEKTVVVSGRPLQDPRYKRGGLVGYLAHMTYRIWSRLMVILNDEGTAAHCSGEFMAMRANVVTWIPKECAVDDAYISVVARKKGFVKFAPKAVAYNIMPSNLRDYINQRRRWLFGHFQTKRITGEYPSVMDTLVLSKPKKVLQVLSQEIQESPMEVPFMVAAVTVEAVIYVLTVLDILFRRQYAVWPIIKSTKVIE
jgi:cellulose synthase/poly-beta-1,6-N-acetylglucosamine synthase-like glycosyltransferase